MKTCDFAGKPFTCKDWASYLEEKGIRLVSLQEAIDTTTSTGKLVFHIFEALAEFERNLIRERTMAGLAAARGKKGEDLNHLKRKQQVLQRLYNDQNLSIKAICEMMNISKPTLYKYL